MKLLLTVALLAAVALAAPAPPNQTVPSSPNTTAPVTAPISFPTPTMLTHEYTTDPVYRSIYNAVANLALTSASPVPQACPWWLSDPTAAVDRFVQAVQAETDVAAAVSHFNNKYDIVGLNSTALINFFNGSSAPPLVSAAQQRLFESELDIIKNVNARNDWLLDYPTCFTVNTSVVAPHGMLPPPAPVNATVFTAQTNEAFVDQSTLRHSLKAYLDLVLGFPANVSVMANQSSGVVTITVEEQGDLLELAARSLADMPASYQSSLGISGLMAAPIPTPSPNTNAPGTNSPHAGHAPAPAAKKSFPLWIIGVIVGALLFLGVAALVISRRNSRPHTDFRDNSTDELSTQNGDYMRV